MIRRFKLKSLRVILLFHAENNDFVLQVFKRLLNYNVAELWLFIALCIRQWRRFDVSWRISYLFTNNTFRSYHKSIYYIWQSTYSIKKYLKTNTYWKCCLYLKIVQSVSHKHYASRTKIKVQTVVHLQSLNAYFHTCYTIDICAIVFTC